MSSIQENKELQTKPKTKTGGSSTAEKKKRPGQRQRRRNKIRSLTTESESTLERLTNAGNTNGTHIPTRDTFSISKKAEPPTASLVLLESGYVLNSEAETLELKSSTLLHTKLLRKSETSKSQASSQNKLLQGENNSTFGEQSIKATKVMPTDTTATPPAAGKPREDILAQREAKKLAKQAKKTKALGSGSQITPVAVPAPVSSTTVAPAQCAAKEKIACLTTHNTTNVDAAALNDKTREQIKAEREGKKKAKQALKAAKATGVPELAAQLDAVKISQKNDATAAPEEKKKPTLSKSERRALQEAQREAKAQKLIAAQKKPATASDTKKATNSTKDTPIKKAATASPSSTTTSISPLTKSPRRNDCKVRLFNHLVKARQDVNLFLNNPLIHPSITHLGEQYVQRTVVGSNARCIAFLNALKMVIRDFETPPKKEFARSLETTITNSVDHLQKCRPLAVSVSNAYKHIKHVLTQLPTDQAESDLKENLCRFIDTYIENQIGKAAEAISHSVQEKISNGDVILTFGCSSLITYIFEEAQRRRVDFRVIVVDSRPFCEGQELLRRLTVKEIPCSYVLINAVSFVMPEATKVLLGAHALLANGYVMARTGTAQVALVAHSFNVPVLVCCETHKFSERSQTDAIVYNELGNPNDLIRSNKCSLSNWQAKDKMTPLNLMYDITPPELVTAVVTEVSILPCTSVPVILRIKPTEIGY
ncbi:translation initiation factor eIF-2B subunit delta [Anastrepha obliqua]|uniref:translation initiation factor eIF-2B subunit delta n=1 Tax=Anastrepha obliqua TaxID=95512 RepID=UPI00240A5131|nr:translation initiation factor eIF-2B subunit delta [Anastrepha obliqua]